MNTRKSVSSENETMEKKPESKMGAGKLFAWSVRGGSTGIAAMVIGYLTIFCTDTMGINPGIVGTLLLASKLLDGVTDLFAGYIVDRTDSRLGKGRPYELCIIGLWGATLALFMCPAQFSLPLKCVWIFIMYALANSVFMTFLNANVTVYMVRAFSNEEDYVKLSTVGGVIPMVMVLAYNIGFPMMMGKLATSQSGWIGLILIFAVPLTLLGLLRFFVVKETNDVDVNTKGEKVKLNDVFTVLKRNPYIYIIALGTLVLNLVTNMGVGAYYFTHIVNNIGLMGLMSASQIIVLPMMFILPAILKKTTVVTTIRVGLIIVIAGNVINFIAGSNTILLAVGSIMTGGGVVPISMLSALLIIDCAEFNEFKGLQRLEGSLSAINGFATKVGAGIGSGILGILIAMAGYDGNLSVQPDSALMMIRLLYSLIPAALYIIVLLCFRFYKLDKMMPEIHSTNAENRAKAAEGIQ